MSSPLDEKKSLRPGSPDTAMTVFCATSEYKPKLITPSQQAQATYLEEIELEHWVARQTKPAGEKIEAGLEERPYRVNAAQGECRSNLLLCVRFGKSIQKKQECDAGDGYRQLDHSVIGCPGLDKRQQTEGVHGKVGQWRQVQSKCPCLYIRLKIVRVNQTETVSGERYRTHLSTGRRTSQLAYISVVDGGRASESGFVSEFFTECILDWVCTTFAFHLNCGQKQVR